MVPTLTLIPPKLSKQMHYFNLKFPLFLIPSLLDFQLILRPSREFFAWISREILPAIFSRTFVEISNRSWLETVILEQLSPRSHDGHSRLQESGSWIRRNSRLRAQALPDRFSRKGAKNWRFFAISKQYSAHPQALWMGRGCFFPLFGLSSRKNGDLTSQTFLIRLS